jgi:hypothetical protein
MKPPQLDVLARTRVLEMKYRSLPHLATTSVECVVMLLLASVFIYAQSGSLRQRFAEKPAGDPLTSQSPQQSLGQSTVRGRVLYSDNGNPIKNVRVVIMTSDSNQSYNTVTNDRGEFQLVGLRAGKYYVTVQGSGIPVPSGFGMTIPLPIVAIPRAEDYPEIIPKHDAMFTVDGTNTAEVEVRIVRGGSITGKILKPDGSPIADVAVNLLFRENNAGPYTARFSARTNQKGVYKIENVTPADYIVSASIEDKGAGYDILVRLRGEGQIVTFHPAAIRLSDALTVHVDSGRESGGVNVTLVDRKSLNISGKLVTGSDGSPIAGATVVLRGKDLEQTGPLVPGMGQRSTVTASDGSWSFNNVSAGDYEITALDPIGGAAVGPVVGRRMPPGQGGRPMLGSGGPSPVRARPRYSVTQKQISLVSSDVENLLLTMRGTGRIRGVVEMENGAPLPSDLVLFFEFADIGSRPTRPEPVRVAIDGSFVFDDVQAGDRPMAAALQAGSDVYVASATMGGKDIREGISIVEGTEGAPLQIQLSTRFARVSGRVTSPTEDQIVVLFLPVEPWKQPFRTAYTAIQTAPDLSFTAKIAPGEYFVLARKRDQLPPISSDFIQRLSGLMRITLVADEQQAVELRLNLRD